MSQFLFLAIVIFSGLVVLLFVGGYSLCVFYEQLVQIASPEEF